MSRKLDNADWGQYINQFGFYKNTVTVKDFCIENDLTKSQFYYHKKRLEKANFTIATFHEVVLKTEESNIEQAPRASKEIKITIENANIVIPTSKTTKANKLVVERDLVYLFDNLSKIDVYDSESLEALMHWLDKVPENMKIKDRK